MAEHSLSRRSTLVRKPAWLKVTAPASGAFRATGAVLDELRLHSVCDEARCPNRGECFSAGTATFLILGDVCTRSCRFCAVKHAQPRPADLQARAQARRRAVDPDEPVRLVEAAARLGLTHVVVTSVTRDDLPDGGAGQFVAAVRALRATLPAATVEVLVPDFGGDRAALDRVLAERPDVLGHNLETVPRLYPRVRPQATYERSLEMLGRAGAAAPPPLVKTGLMVGLGETRREVRAVLADCARYNVDVVTIGQYLQPDSGCLPVARYVAPEEFPGLQSDGARLGLQVVAGPFVRSSYRAAEVFSAALG
jgi:lipoic acid synthetase